MNLTKTAIQRPVFVLMAMLAIVLLGAMAYFSMRVELNPDVASGVVTVTTVYPGAGSDEVNNLVGKKIEDVVSGIANLEEVVSTSQEGVSSVTLNFAVGTNMDVALNDVKAKVDGAIGNIPKEANKPIVDKFDFSSSPVMTIAMSSDKLSLRDLRDVLDNKVRDKFARIPGVAQVGVNGGDTREIQVRVSKDALVRFGIGIVDLQRALQTATINVPSGRVVEGAQEYTVRLLGEFRSVKDIEDFYVPLSGSRQGDPTRKIRLGDIATIKDTIREVRSRSRLDGKDTVIVVVQKTKQGNAVEIAGNIKAATFPNPDFAAAQKNAKPGEKIKIPEKVNLLKNIEQE
ncbi:MAG: efflux RND transporter permease subunit, partial [Armatimonadota bacterium]